MTCIITSCFWVPSGTGTQSVSSFSVWVHVKVSASPESGVGDSIIAVLKFVGAARGGSSSGAFGGQPPSTGKRSGSA